MDAESIARINALAKKKHEEGLTPEETAEQQRLRAQYLEEFRRGMEQTLQNVRIKEPAGTLTPLVKKADKK